MAKRVPLKKIALKGMVGDLVYKDEYLNALKNPSDPQSGIDYEEMARRIPLIQKIDKAGVGSLVLEDAEHQVLEQCLRMSKFRQVVPEVFEMITEVVNAEDVAINAEAEAG